MRNETGESSKSASPRDAKELEADVRRAVEQGEDIQENVRGLTLMALGAEPLDLAMSRLLLKSRDRRCWDECYAAFVV